MNVDATPSSRSRRTGNSADAMRRGRRVYDLNHPLVSPQMGYEPNKNPDYFQPGVLILSCFQSRIRRAGHHLMLLK